MALNITFPDGGKKTYDQPQTPLQIASSLSNSLAKNAIAALVNGEKAGLDRVLDGDVNLSILTFDDAEGQAVFHHSSSHIMAQAVLRLYPDTKLGIGPAIKNGFYYDFDSEHIFTEDDMSLIENEMAKIIKENNTFVRKELSRREALDFFGAAGEIYKVELINDLPEDAVISTYMDGDFIDLCAGPHLPATGAVKAFKLMSLAGAYWRGDEKNKMLQRIYATSFPKQAQLDDYLLKLEEARKRDHRRLGTELELFMMHEAAPGFPFFLPKGMVLRNALENFWREEHKKAGYEEIRTPMILNERLWHESGHWDHYKENMYFTTIDELPYAVKPMNCPGGMLIYGNRLWSYRDLPLRYAEMGLVHRHELSGALHGLMRVRCFTQDDAHIYMLPEQISQEILGVIELVDRIYKVFGFEYKVELSTRPEKFMGEMAQWDFATDILRQALETRGVSYIINEGDGAFYGPKIDFHLVDSLERTWQCATLQLDFQMPERFALEYVGADGEKHRPVMIHRTVFGSMERFIGILIEHYAGAFPAWLAPVQVKVMGITDAQADYARGLTERLLAENIRAEFDGRNEKIGYKIRAAQTERVPYMLVVGAKEQEAGLVSVRHRHKGDLGAKPFEDFLTELKAEIDGKLN